VWQNISDNCYLLASLAAVAVHHPDHIKSLFTDEQDGTYSVTVCGTDTMRVNTLLPVNSHDQPLFATPHDTPPGNNAIWPAIYQKAYTMRRGGYGVMKEGAFAYIGLTAVTNCFDITYYRFKDGRWASYDVRPGEKWMDADWFGDKGDKDFTDFDDDAAFYQILNDAWNAGCPMTASSDRHVVAIVGVAGDEIKIRDQADWNSPVKDIDLAIFPFIAVCRGFETMQVPVLTKHYSKDFETFKSAMSLYPGCSLFSHRHPISQDDVWQNISDNCYLLASLAAVAVHHPDHIKSLFTDEQDGTYSVTVCGTDTMRVNTLLPVNSHDQPLFATPHDTPPGNNAIWPAIYQKAYTMRRGGYGVMKEGAFAYIGLTAVTNCFDITYYRFKDGRWASYDVRPGEKWMDADWFGDKGDKDFTDFDDDAAFYQILNDAWNAGCPMTASSDRHVVAIVGVAGDEIKIRDQQDWSSPVKDIDLAIFQFIAVCRL